MDDEGFFDPWSIGQSPVREARELFDFCERTGGEVESVRELIDVPAADQAELHALARDCPEVAQKIANVLAFRRRVLVEFEGLVQSRQPLA